MSQTASKMAMTKSKSTAAQNSNELVVDEHEWTYVCCVLNPTLQKTTSTQPVVVVGSDSRIKVRVTGAAAADVKKLKDLCGGYPVVSRFCRIGSSQNQSVRELEDIMNSLKAIFRRSMLEKVCIRLANDPSYCEIIGPSRDVDDVRSEFENAMRTGSTSTTLQPIVGARASAVVATSSPLTDRGGFDYLSKKLNLTVSVINGDILSQTCDVIVCPSNHQGTPSVGVGRKIIDAAGTKVVQEFRQMAKHRKFNETDVFDTSAGNLGLGVKNIIHAHGPIYLGITNPNKSVESLKRTFFNCFKYAETELKAKFMVLPAIGGGNGGFSAKQVSEAACEAIEEFETWMGSKPTYLREITFVDINLHTCQTMADSCTQHFHMSPLEPGQQVSDAPSSPLTTTNTLIRTTTSLTTPTITTAVTRNVSVTSNSNVSTVLVPSSPRTAASNGEVPTAKLVDFDSSSSSADVINSTSRPDTSAAATAAAAAAAAKSTHNPCPICMDAIVDERKLDCGHVFCEKCIDECFKKHQPRCPCCGKIFGHLKGEPLKGQRMSLTKRGSSLAGFDGCGTTVITYTIPDGFKDGRRYAGVTRQAYLPNNEEGNAILKLLEEAFECGLIFTIGRSTTTGREHVITWNDIHHKTAPTGPHGYPDATYLKRVRQELAAKGIGVQPPPPAAAAAATGNTMTSAATHQSTFWY